MPSYTIKTASGYQRLQIYLQEGWSIHPPVFVNPNSYRYRTSDTYHFILERNSSHQLLVVPRSPKIDQFISEKQLNVNHL